MSLDSTLQAIDALPLADAIRESPWMFPVIETIHVFAISIVVGSIGMLDLRLLGLRTKDRSVMELATEVLPWTWVSFAVAVCAGSMLFMSHAVKYAHNGPFQLKMAMLVLAGLNMASFHLTSFRGVRTWGILAKPPAHARIAGGLSLFFWIFVVLAGRWIGFTT